MPSAWPNVEKALLRASNIDSGDTFGSTVAISGNIAVVGAPNEDSSGNGTSDAGAAYVFERDTSGAWSETALLRPTNSTRRSRFGRSLSISENTILFGDRQGALVFDRDESGEWSQTAVLYPSDPQEIISYGHSVAISGNTAFVAATSGPSGKHTLYVGEVYVFERSESGEWSETALLRSSNPGLAYSFGVSVAINDGIAIVGANREDDPSSGTNATGAAHIFERSESGAWSETALLNASNAGSDRFGTAVAVTDGIAIVGAYLESGPSDASTWSGAAYIYERDEMGTWSETALLRPAMNRIGDRFGYSVAVSGNIAIIGATGGDGPLDNMGEVGEVNVFTREESGAWSEVATLNPSNAGSGDAFGASVAISGSVAVIGAPEEDGPSDGLRSAGAVYVFEDAPNVIDDSAETPEDTPVTIAVLANDDDGLRVTAVSTFVNGIAEINDGETVTFTPSPDFHGMGSFTYTAADETGEADATVTVTITPINDAPGPVDDAAETPEDTPVTIEVLQNDADPDAADDLSVTAVSDVMNGSAVINHNNTVTFTPSPDFHGEASFTYTVDDGSGPVGAPATRMAEETASVTVTVTPVNDAPTSSEVTSPANGTGLILSGDPSEPVLFSWSQSTDADGETINYTYEVSVLESFEVLLFSIETTDTSATITQQRFADELASIKIGPGATLMLHQRVIASDEEVAVTGRAGSFVLQRRVLTATEDIPTSFAVLDGYPNPTEGLFTIRVDMPSSGSVRVEVFDLLGRLVHLLDNASLSAGASQTVELGVDRLEAGTYLFRVTADLASGAETASSRLTVLR